MSRALLPALVALCSLSRPVLAQRAVHPVTARELVAIRLSEPITLDGHLDEAAWQSADVASDFRQVEPREGLPATQRTEVRIAYDEAAIYIGARLYDSLGADGVVSRLVRRDHTAGADYLDILFDTYHDHLGRTEFTINPAGVRGDGYGPGGAGVDESWDPVWEAKTRVDSAGWTAELRIPFSQLRYPAGADQTWGLQIYRISSSRNETSAWAFWRANESGGPTRFGHLTGLDIESAPGRAEILPYVVARSTNVPAGDPANPFADPHTFDGRVGADARLFLNSSLTLSATVNPDFGQVEGDPAVVNLSAFETFFDEKRPFFVESAGLFSFGGLNCYFCSNVSGLSLFYSRRIGRAPQAAGNAFRSAQFADIPENSTILGAGKLTGRTPSGWSIGLLDAVTRRERARTLGEDGTLASVTVEPLTNYFVGRVAKDLRGGSTVVRAMGTSVVRQLDDPFLRQSLTSHAEAGGLSTDWYFGQREYRLMAQFAVSQVAGDSSAIARIQRSSARYFQRPDREPGGNGIFSDAYDPTMTSLRGFAGYLRMSKQSGDWLWEAQTNIRSPGFEVNDLAFLSRADYVWMGGNVLRQYTVPGSWYRNLTLTLGAQQQFNFDGDRTDRQLHAAINGELPNYWDAQLFVIHRVTSDDDRLTRGGPVVKRNGYNFVQSRLSTDDRRAVTFGLNAGGGLGFDDTDFISVGVDASWRPASNIQLSVGPQFSYDETSAQYVTAVDDPTATDFYGRRYVFARTDQRTLSMNTRLNVTFTPNLSLELFAQPFISGVRYHDFEEFAAPRTLDKLVYGVDVGTIDADNAGASTTYTVDPDGGGPAASFSFDDPTFTLRSLRGNAVLRWEYLPGSTLFLVWTQTRSDVLRDGGVDLGRDVRGLVDGAAENVFLLKLNYFFGL